MSTQPPAQPLAQSMIQKMFEATSLKSGRRSIYRGVSHLISLGLLLLLTLGLLLNRPVRAISRSKENADGQVGALRAQKAPARVRANFQFREQTTEIREAFQPRNLWDLMTASRWSAFAPKSLFATITVNTTADTVAVDGACSLREAIMSANTNFSVNECGAGSGLDTIVFALGGGTPTINVSTGPLPDITAPLIIQGDTGGATRLRLNGAGGDWLGLQVSAPNVSIFGLVISNFGGNGIVINGAEAYVQNCFIGTDATGTVAEGNLNGILLNGIANTVFIGTDSDGFGDAAEGNVISGNSLSGVEINAVGGITVAGNLIGLNAAGNAAIPNGKGVTIANGPNNIIGGTDALARNIISGNSGNGVEITGGESFSNSVVNNIIGRNPANTINIPNGGNGVLIGGCPNNAIGLAGSPNVIAGNGQKGVLITNGVGNQVSNNSIFGNAGLAIDLSGDGIVTPNDNGDLDSGANDLQNFPVINSVTVTGEVNATLNSTPSGNYTIEFFANTDCDQSGNGEGEVYLGSTNVNTDDAGTVNFTFIFVPIAGKNFITATATDSFGNTSEFSACQSACGFSISPTVSSYSASAGSGIVNVTAAGGCPWTAVSNAAWIVITAGASGTGNGTVSYTVAANGSNSPRSGTVTIAGLTLTVTQTVAGAIIVGDFIPGTFPPAWNVVDGGTPAVYDNTGTPLTWTTLNPCNQIIPPPFAGTFAIVDAGCTAPGIAMDEELRLPPFDATGLGSVFVEFYSQFEWDASVPDNKGDVDVSTDGGLTWTNVLRLENGDDGVPTPVLKSLNITPYISENPANVLVRLHYYGMSPSSNLRASSMEKVHWAVDFGVYSYALTPSSQSFPAGGGTGTISVATSTAIPSPQGEWTAVSSVQWITITSSIPVTGNGMVTYTVAPNPGGSRSGTITVSGRTFTVTQSCVPSPAGFIAWYPAEDNANDQQGTNHGTLQNGANFAAGFIGRAFNFDGVDDYVQTMLDAQPSALPNTTWEAWVYPTRVNHNTRQSIFSTDDGGFDRAVTIEADSVNFGVFTGTDVWQPVAVTLNQWQHIAVVYTPSGIEFYKDGVKYTHAGAPTGQATANRFHIGRNPSAAGEYYEGLVDEIGIYNRALTQAEIQTVVTAGSAGRCGVCPTTTVGPENSILPAGTTGQPYSQSFTANGGVVPYTFTLNTGSLPDGLAIGTNGVLSGTPASSGNYNFTVLATDAKGCSGVGTYTLTISTLCGAIVISPGSLANGVAGISYNQTFTAMGGTGALMWSVASGSLPAGLMLSSAGVLSGTPTLTGSFSFTVKATDANSCMGTVAYTLMINCPTINVGPLSIASGNAGIPYSQQFTQTGGVGTVAFTTLSTLPAGITLSSSGLLSGTTNQVGSFPITIKATDLNGCMGTANYTLAITCPMVTLSSLASGMTGTAYSQMLTASPAGGNYSFAVTMGSLPPGLSLSSSGALTGTPTTGGTFNFTVTATGFGSCTGAQAYSLTINCPAITLSPAALPNAAANAAYSQNITAAPSGTNYSFALTSGDLPAGLSLAANGVISGSPTQSGTFNFRITATGFGSCTGFRDYTLVVGCVTVVLTPASLPGGTIGTAYNQSVSGTPAGAYSYSVTSGALPLGLTLNGSTGAITGTPTASGTFTFTIRASAGSCTGSSSYTVTIGCPSISFTTTSLPAGAVGGTYSQTLTVTPSGAYTFSLIVGSLPSGVTLNATTGVISGLPLVTGTFNFTIKTQAANGCSATQAYSLAINCPSIVLMPVALPNGTTGTAYSQAVTASPAGGNYSFAVTSGSLPAGLTLNAATGVLSGTPATNGTSTFTITATGFGGCTGSKSYTVVIGGGSCPTITLPDLSNGVAGQLYSKSVAATPAGTYNYAVTSGSLPPGLTIFGAFGLIYGYPAAAGTYSFTLTATDSNQCTGNKSYSVVIGGAALRSFVFGDFDGDGKADLSIWRVKDGNWLTLKSGDGQLQNAQWGTSVDLYNDITVPGDYDGDGKMDLAVFSRSKLQGGQWRIKGSKGGEVTTEVWGLATDTPVPADYDGDGKTDIAVWRGAESNWYILRSSDHQTQVISWGTSNAPYRDVPVPADYDGDGKADVAVFRQSTGHWYIKLSSDGSVVDKFWGLGTDVPVPADYDGDGKADIAVWRGTDTNWYIVRSSDGQTQAVSWGISSLGDVPVPGDYDGDGKADIAVWRATEGNWYVRLSRDGSVMTKAHGQSGDAPAVIRPRP